MPRNVLWILFAIFALTHLAFLVAAMRLPSGLAEYLLRALLLGLFADNLIVAAGAFAFEAPWYAGASWLRYIAHVVLLPPMVLAGLELLRRAGSRFAAGHLASVAGLGFALAAVSYGFAAEILGLELARETLLGHDRYISAHAGLPLATIVTNLVILVVAAALWRAASWPWLFAGALTIFAVNGAAAGSDWGIVAGNVAELVFAAAWLTSLRRFRAT